MKLNAATAVRDPASVRLWRRLAAILYDLLVVVALLMSLTIAVILVRGGRAIGAGSLWFQGLLLSAWWLYFVWCWTHGGQTLGMRAWRLVLETDDARPIGPGLASLRFAAAGLSAIAAGLGFVWSLVDPDRRCWHDRLTGTRLRFRAPSAQAQDRNRSNDE